MPRREGGGGRRRRTEKKRNPCSLRVTGGEQEAGEEEAVERATTDE